MQLLSHGARARFDDLKLIGAAAWPTHEVWFDRAQAPLPLTRLSPHSPLRESWGC
jgi:hypothetical protein